MRTARYFFPFLFLYFGASFYAQVDPYSIQIKENFDEYIGTYLPPYTTGLQPMEVTAKEDKLFFSFKGSNVTTEIKFTSKAKYASDNPKNQIRFEKCNGWRVSHLYLNMGRGDVIFIRQNPKQEITTNMPVACKSVTVTACISYEVNLHIKGNSIFWETVRGVPPGTSNECGLAIQVNELPWKDWKTPHILDFNTAGLTVQPFVLHSQDFAELIQVPNASNGWETIFHFLDLHRTTHPHTHSVVFYFCPPGSIEEPMVHRKTKDPYNDKEVKIVVDTLLYKRINMDVATHKLFFEPGKAELTPAAKLELRNIYDTLKTNNKTVEIIGYEKMGDDSYKLYYERSLSVAIYFINIGLDQTRIRFFGYGEDNQLIEEDLKKKIKLAIKEKP